jgi:vacuolar-type H+-ATPase subunit F/Vma7
MAHALRVLCRPEIAMGFALAGVEPVAAATPRDATLRLADLVARPETGVVLIQETLYDGLPEDMRRRVGRRALPLVVPFPGPAWAARPDTAEAYIVDLLRQVIGYRVRLR